MHGIFSQFRFIRESDSEIWNFLMDKFLIGWNFFFQRNALYAKCHICYQMKLCRKNLENYLIFFLIIIIICMANANSNGLKWPIFCHCLRWMGWKSTSRWSDRFIQTTRNSVIWMVCIWTTTTLSNAILI